MPLHPALPFDSVLAQVAPVAPGGGGGAPAPAQPAPASGGGGGGSAPGGGGMTSLLFPVLIFVAFYFFLIRPQQKKAKELESKLKKGDRVFLNSGLIGKIVDLSEKRATIELAPNVKVQCLRTAIGGIDEGDAPAKADDKADAKPAEAKK